MYRSIPIQNKIVAAKIHEKDRQLHLNKLNSMKSTINTKAPGTFKHVGGNNKKKVQLKEDKLSEIERENRILLQKLTSIMKSPQAFGEYAAPLPPQTASSKSLNRDYRKRELVKITIENQLLSKRLSEKKSNYDVTRWLERHRVHEQYLKNICEYPLRISTGSLSKSPPRDEKDTFYNEIEVRPHTIDFRKNRSEKTFNFSTRDTATEPREKNFSQSSNMKKRPARLDPLAKFGGDGLKNILFKAKKKIGFSHFDIEIFNDHNKNFTIAAKNIERHDTKMMVITDEEGMKLVEKFQNNYEKLIDVLRFKGDQIFVDEEEENYRSDHAIEKLLMANEKNLDKDNDIVEIASDNQGESETSAILHNQDADDEESKDTDNFGFISQSFEGQKENNTNNKAVNHADPAHEESQPPKKKDSLKNQLNLPILQKEELRHISENEEENEIETSNKRVDTTALKKQTGTGGKTSN
jgi:E3 ubiquitin-protein ligase TRIP12